MKHNAYIQQWGGWAREYRLILGTGAACALLAAVLFGLSATIGQMSALPADILRSPFVAGLLWPFIMAEVMLMCIAVWLLGGVLLSRLGWTAPILNMVIANVVSVVLFWALGGDWLAIALGALAGGGIILALGSIYSRQRAVVQVIANRS